MGCSHSTSWEYPPLGSSRSTFVMLETALQFHNWAPQGQDLSAKLAEFHYACLGFGCGEDVRRSLGGA
eukprot:2440205-Prorocentrum_lima.AAC.1